VFGKHKISLLSLVQGVLSVSSTMALSLWIGSAIERQLTHAKAMDSNIKVVLARLIKASLLLMAFFFSLSAAGIDLTMLSVFGGAVGVGLGLGLQRIASNYVSGFIILFDRSIRIGDMITLETYYGEVTDITTRYTVIRALDGTEAIMPNEMFINLPVKNHSYSSRTIRVATKITIGYQADLSLALKLMEQAALAESRVVADPEPFAMLLNFGSYGLELELGFWIADPENGQMNIRSAVNQRILALFNAHQINIPYPIHHVELQYTNVAMQQSTSVPVSTTAPMPTVTISDSQGA
jgi:small-conductance mechanosensitive channel